jgi:hypothetical protein
MRTFKHWTLAALCLACSGCGDEAQPAVEDLPLAQGLEIVAPASACPLASRHCTLRVMVRGPAGESEARVVDRQVRVARRAGWRVSAHRDGVITLVRAELSLEVHGDAAWAPDALEPRHPVIGLLLERPRRQ